LCGQAYFYVNVIGSGPFDYSWYRNGVEIVGATDSWYLTPPVEQDDNESTYHCVVANCEGAYQVTSESALLSVEPPCTFEIPAISLSAALLEPEEILTISGIRFTPGAQALIAIRNNLGQIVFEDIIDPIDILGSFEYDLEVGMDYTGGEYSV